MALVLISSCPPPTSDQKLVLQKTGTLGQITVGRLAVVMSAFLKQQHLSPALCAGRAAVRPQASGGGKDVSRKTASWSGFAIILNCRDVYSASLALQDVR